MVNIIMMLFVAIGGAIGAVVRFQVTNLFNSAFGNAFPYATLTVNVVGSFIIGVVSAALLNNLLISEHWRPLIIVGFLGALTTFSSFSLDTFMLFSHGEFVKAGLNVILNVVLCLLAVTAGYYLILKTS